MKMRKFPISTPPPMTSKKNPIHGVKKQSLLDRKWFVESLSFVPAVTAGAAASAKFFFESSYVLGWGLAIACAWTVAFSIIKVIHAKRQDERDDDLRSHDGLVAALTVVHELVARAAGLSQEEKMKCLRATFHRVVPPVGESDEIEQIVNYVGGAGDGAGRKFPIRSGITGQAIRENAVFVMDRQSDAYEDYKKELIRHWHYTEKDIRSITSDRFSAIAVPIQSRNGQQVIGVVYLDSSKKNFFSSDAVKEAVANGCWGIARYTGERYV
ncbi:hypothetical protein QFZ42_001798 [Variovorax paradoxus]|uniref:GAF domain-containing protein n=1 Tax=Variovorax paradoxus TaxID=34073 RepID=UPI00278CC4DF|nr:GAF domain-containing protein [Variovorax paradoxus]MDQ0569964.1 hypothetical protein [Variovorax paradoxus]